ncbi:class I SAM-dependent methyltransferase [Mangrovibacillus cuniculi]|uniref:Class I SAM-dependent methyltransferase n=1 Tax=Mangrovibacillus cuniculi TaxID=2593652 RepID=A0A7S8HFK8_9BACI|nr:class I SAM-dependent methyltransferase [Mangrovibacillus cuniculi]QPC46626.1 class I SAM-dependent methyltransferase [Mangrovibacillus cuniculi]
MNFAPNLIVTTAYRSTRELEEEAARIAASFHVLFVERKKQSIPSLQKRYSCDVFVVGKEREEWFPLGQLEPIFFHPNSAMFRAKRIFRGESDPFLEACALREGMKVIDATLGLGSDAIIASLVTGLKGKVTGIEANPILAHIVKQGLASYQEGADDFLHACRRIDVRQGNHLVFLKSRQMNDVDIVYLDPMFETEITESNGINQIRAIAYGEDVFDETITEALRVASHRVVLKDHYQSSRFTKYPFQVIKRKTALFHFGYIDVPKR